MSAESENDPFALIRRRAIIDMHEQLTGPRAPDELRKAVANNGTFLWEIVEFEIDKALKAAVSIFADAGTDTASPVPKKSINSQWVGRAVSVIFDDDRSKTFKGHIIMDDATAYRETIIELEDGRFVRASECRYRLAD